MRYRIEAHFFAFTRNFAITTGVPIWGGAARDCFAENELLACDTSLFLARLLPGIPGHVLKQSSGTNPGQESQIRDCPGVSRTVGNYVSVL